MDDLSNDELFTLLYYDVKTGFTSAPELYPQAKAEKITILFDDVKKMVGKATKQTTKGL